MPKSTKITLKIPLAKPRNPTIAVLKTKKGGPHGKDQKAQRREQKVTLQRQKEEE